MCIFLQREDRQVNVALHKCKVMHNLQASKKQRLKRRINALLLSKRGLTTAFAAGALRTVYKSRSSNHDSKAGKSKHASSLARFGLSAWLGA
jgi:hypothetical protein